MKAVLALTVCGLAAVSGNRYVCDTAAYEGVEDTVADLDYDQRYQQQDIDDFNEQLDDLLALAAGNNTCGAEELHNVDEAAYSIILGGCENHLFSGSDHSTIGGGQRNWGYTDAKLVAISGGMHNIATGDWAAIIGGIKNKAYSNYASVLGGYLGKANAKFATVAGGSKNTVAGRYGVVMGQKVKVTGDHTFGLGFNGGATCAVRGDHTFGACTQAFTISTADGDFDLLAELSSRRQLTDVSKEVEKLEEENFKLEKLVMSKLESLLDSGRLNKDAMSSITSMLSTH